jgi:uncharacterized membrane-anchored protein
MLLADFPAGNGPAATRPGLRKQTLLRLVFATVLSCLAGTIALGAPSDRGSGTESKETPDQILVAVLRQSIGAPARAEIGDQASVRLSDDLLFVPPEAAIEFLSVSGKPIPANFNGLLFGAEGVDALGIIRFVPSGFVDSDAALAWTEDDILGSLEDTVEHGNPERTRNGLPQREARRWVVPPHYSPELHQLSWAALILPRSAARDSDGEITYHAVSFGREGYIDLMVVTSTQKAEGIARMGDGFLRGLNFRPGKAYGDALPTDKRAEGGLAAVMGVESLHKVRVSGGFLAGDKVFPVAGGTVAAVGGLSLFLYIRRHFRNEARRG